VGEKRAEKEYGLANSLIKQGVTLPERYYKFGPDITYDFHDSSARWYVLMEKINGTQLHKLGENDLEEAVAGVVTPTITSLPGVYTPHANFLIVPATPAPCAIIIFQILIVV